MYEILAGCDAFMTDYSSAAFDAAVMKIPVFLYADDYGEYEAERGRLLWDLRKMPFPLALDDEEVEGKIVGFQEAMYLDGVETEGGGCRLPELLIYRALKFEIEVYREM